LPLPLHFWLSPAWICFCICHGVLDTFNPPHTAIVKETVEKSMPGDAMIRRGEARPDRASPRQPYLSPAQHDHQKGRVDFAYVSSATTEATLSSISFQPSN
jgi:hypothetical protein